MSDDLRSALESAIDEAETTETPAAAPEVEQASTPEPDTTVEASETQDVVEATDAPAVEKDAPPSEAKPADKPEGAKAETAAEIKQHRIDRPPQSWKKEAKGEWGNMPLHVRQEVHKREAEISRALQESAPARQFAEHFNQTIAPYQARMQAMGASPIQAVQNLLQADYQLSSAPKQQRAALMAKFIKDYDIDVVELDNALVGNVPQQPQTSPDIEALVQQQLQQALAPLLQQQQAHRQQQQEQINHTVESMALDPKYPYFEDVRGDMADLIDVKARQGIDLSLEDAYSMATRMNPDVYSQMTRQSSMQTANQQHAQAQRAKNAASSVSGAPAAGGANGFVGNGDLRSSIEAAFGGARL
jgi:hypothetical protein